MRKYQALLFLAAVTVFFPGVLPAQTLNLDYSTFLGGYKRDLGLGMCLRADGAAYITGRTESPDFPTENPYQSVFGGGDYDVFVSGLSSSGSDLIYSTYLQISVYIFMICFVGYLVMSKRMLFM